MYLKRNATFTPSLFILSCILVLSHGAFQSLKPYLHLTDQNVNNVNKLKNPNAFIRSPIDLRTFRTMNNSNVMMASSSSSSDSTIPGTNDSTDNESTENMNVNANTDIYKDERSKLKQELLVLSASYDRGYGATSTSRSSVNDIVTRLKAINPCENASFGIVDDPLSSSGESSLLKGIWQMVWTTAQDVLLLNASPFSTVGAIYQVISDPPVIVNIIDLIPRSQALLPPGVASSLLRLQVTTRARRIRIPSASASMEDGNRIGLTFEKVRVQPVQFLGMDLNDSTNGSSDGILPKLEVPLPTNVIANLIQSVFNIDINEMDSFGFFDVIYLDEDLLIIQQNAPGGIFVLARSDSYDP